ncbi:hypothetical protein [Hymenobacter sp. 5414T-23]|uniref:hypothetical protein n=1 Tax=Hymenobacter sp. 5414T-23 TaxID=2932252 RepID=UPI001FD4AE4B|nr:hypothetical protein [Hymenobacter sp. 5414T-23]UOQ81015.1 hypothetical protein MUN83_19745 [Hymenobacter sp. 5414T-23]
MATRTAYQKQADTRTKMALRLRARFDARIRKYAQALIDALAGAADAKNRIDRINTLYGVDISTETLLAHEVRVANLGGQLGTLLGQSTPGEEVQLFNPTVNGNGGVTLALETLFGEVATTAPTPPSAPVFSNTLIGPNDSAGGVTLAAQAGDDFGFNALSTGGSAPMSMDLYHNGQQVGSVAYLDRYNGQRFRFAGPLGTFSGTFASGPVNL